MNLRNDIIAGTRFSAITNIVRQIFNFTVTIIMARLLSPEIFGMLAMATVFTGVNRLFVDFGTKDAIIRHQDVNRGFLSSLFWFNLSVGIVFFLIMVLASGWIADFYGYPVLQKIVIVTSVNIIISAMAIVPRAILYRKMIFRAFFLEVLIMTPLSGCVGIYMAWRGFGVWSLVAQQMISLIGGSILVWVLAGWYPLLSFNIIHIKQIFSYSTYLSLTKFSDYFTKQGDLFLIGKYLGAVPLGIYSKGYGFLRRPLKLINGTIVPVLFSTISKIQEDTSRLRSYFLSAAKNMAIIYFPLWVGSVFLAEPLIMVVLGEQWKGIIPLVPIFTTNLIFLAFGSIGTHYLKALGETKKLFNIVLISSIITLLSFVVGLFWGIEGVAIGYCLATIIKFFLLTIPTSDLIDLPLNKIIKSLKIDFLGAIVMALGIYFALRLIPMMEKNYLLELVIGGASGLVTYIAIFWFFQPKSVHALVWELMGLNKRK